MTTIVMIWVHTHSTVLHTVHDHTFKTGWNGFQKMIRNLLKRHGWCLSVFMNCGDRVLNSFDRRHSQLVAMRQVEIEHSNPNPF